MNYPIACANMTDPSPSYLLLFKLKQVAFVGGLVGWSVCLQKISVENLLLELIVHRRLLLFG